MEGRVWTGRRMAIAERTSLRLYADLFLLFDPLGSMMLKHKEVKSMFKGWVFGAATAHIGEGWVPRVNLSGLWRPIHLDIACMHRKASLRLSFAVFPRMNIGTA